MNRTSEICEHYKEDYTYKPDIQEEDFHTKGTEKYFQ